MQFFDVNTDLHEAHLLAYLNLLDSIVATSDSLVTALCGSSGAGAHAGTYETREHNRAVRLAKETTAKKVMQELGLWKL